MEITTMLVMKFQDQKLNLTPMALLGCMMTKITIGAGVPMDKKEFGSNFQNFYKAGGAGTYLLINKEWVKQ